MENKKFGLILVLFLFVAFLSALPVAYSETGGKPTWAETGSFARYSIELDLILENIETGENSEYSGSGTVRWQVSESNENYAIVMITPNIDWEDGQAPTGFPTQNEKENWHYGLCTSGYVLSEEEIGILENGKLPEGIKGSYEGVESLEGEYGTVETFYICREKETDPGYRSNETHYGTGSGILLKQTLESEQNVSESPYVQNESSLILKETNIDIGTAKTKFSVDALNIKNETIGQGESTEITVEVSNTGGKESSKIIHLEVDGERVDRETVRLAPGEFETVEFTASGDEKGTHEVKIEGMSGSFEVRESSGNQNWILMSGIVGIVVAALVFLLYEKEYI